MQVIVTFQLNELARVIDIAETAYRIGRYVDKLKVEELKELIEKKNSALDDMLELIRKQLAPHPMD